MCESVLIQVDLDSLQSSAEGSLDIKTIAYLKRVQIVVTPSNFEVAKDFLREHFRDFTTYCDVIALDENYTDALSLLDLGASRIFVCLDQFIGIVYHKSLEDLSRLIVSFDHADCAEGDPDSVARELQDEVESRARDWSVGVAVHDVHDWPLLDAMKELKKDEGYPLTYITLAYNTWDHYQKIVSKGHVPIVPATQFTVHTRERPDLIPAWLLITTAISTDRPDKLYPTVVTDEHGICLGLVYSSDRSVEVALSSGSGVYWSRSRNKLWVKGAESGDTQELVSIGWDCDADALHFTVRQKGAGIWLPMISSGSTLTRYRFLPFEDSDLLWSLYRYGTSPEYTARS